MFDGNKLRKIRESNNISRAELAREAHIPIRSLEDWEYERRPILKFERLNRIARILDCSLQDFCKDGVELYLGSDYLFSSKQKTLFTKEEFDYIYNLMKTLISINQDSPKGNDYKIQTQINKKINKLYDKFEKST